MKIVYSCWPTLEVKDFRVGSRDGRRGMLTLLGSSHCTLPTAQRHRRKGNELPSSLNTFCFFFYFFFFLVTLLPSLTRKYRFKLQVLTLLLRSHLPSLGRTNYFLLGSSVNPVWVLLECQSYGLIIIFDTLFPSIGCELSISVISHVFAEKQPATCKWHSVP